MINLDLRTALATLDLTTLGTPGACKYTAPCVIGAMMTPEQRALIAAKGENETRIATLAGCYGHKPLVTFPREQLDDFELLQRTFDRGRTVAPLVEELKVKYGVQ